MSGVLPDGDGSGPLTGPSGIASDGDTPFPLVVGSGAGSNGDGVVALERATGRRADGNATFALVKVTRVLSHRNAALVLENGNVDGTNGDRFDSNEIKRDRVSISCARIHEECTFTKHKGRVVYFIRFFYWSRMK